MQGRVGWCLVLVCATAVRALTVGGSVVDASGHALGGARVGAQVDGVVYQTTADATGRFGLELPRVVGEELTLLALAEGALGWYHGPAGPSLTVATMPTFTATGQVVGEDRRPLVGATVTVHGLGRSRAGYQPPEVAWPGPPWPRWTTVTNAEGDFALPGVPTRALVAVTVQHDRYRPLVSHLPHQGELEPLQRGETLTGGLIRPDGTPLPRLTVTATRREVDGPPLRFVQHALTDEGGAFRLEGLLDLAQCDLGLDDPTGALVLRSVVRRGATAELVAVPGIMVHARAVDVDTGRPAAGVPLALQWAHESPLPRRPELDYQPTDAQGEVTWRVAPGRCQVSLGVGWLDEEPTGWRGAQVLTVEGPLDVVVKVRRARMLRGVLREAGAPAGGLRVSAARLGQQVDSDSAGRFELARVAAGVPLELSIYEPSSFVRRVVTVTPPATETDLVLELPPLPRGELAGRVVDAAGQPLAGVEVLAWMRWQDPADDQEARQRRRWGPPNDAQHRRFLQTTGADGRFNLRRLPLAATYGLSCQLAGREGRFLTAPAPVDGHWTLGDVVMPLLGKHVTGRVVDAQGRPAAGATVLALGPRGTETVSGADGRFALPVLPAGPRRLLALHGRAEQGEADAPDGVEVTFTVAEQAPLTAAEHRALLVAALRARPADTGVDARVEGDRLLALLDADAWLQQAAALPPEDGWTADLRGRGLLALAQSAPTACLRHLDWLDALKDAQWRAHLRRRVGLALSKTQPTESARLFAAAALEPAPGTQLGALEHAAWAARLGRPEAPALARAALDLATAKPDEWGQYPRYAAWLWGDQPALLELLLTARPANEQRDLQLLAAAGLARRDPLAAATRLRALATPEERVGGNGRYGRAADLLALTARGGDPAALAAAAERLPAEPARRLYLGLAERTADTEQARGWLVRAVLLGADRSARDQHVLGRLARRAAPELAAGVARAEAEQAAAPGNTVLQQARAGLTNAARLRVERLLYGRPGGGQLCVTGPGEDSPTDLAAALAECAPRRCLELAGATDTQLAAFLGPGLLWSLALAPADLRGADALGWLTDPHAVALAVARWWADAQ